MFIFITAGYSVLMFVVFSRKANELYSGELTAHSVGGRGRGQVWNVSQNHID